MIAGCTGAPPARRSIGLGFEDVTAGPERWERLGPQLGASGANAVSLAVGRVDWTAFPWPADATATASIAESTGSRDLVAESLHRIAEHMGDETQVTLTIDALAPRLIEAEPGLAGVGPDGARSDSFASVSALENGPVGDRIVQLAGDLADRYGPDRIALTELMFDASTFGDDDLASYRARTGAADWPRDGNGQIDTGHASLGQWRSQALTALLARVVDAVSANGIEVEMDVRAPEDPSGDRALSGHDYELLLTAAHRIAVWNYFGLSGQPPSVGEELSRALERRFPGRCTISTGLWGADESISAPELREGLEAVARGGASAVAVTPASLLSQGHWRSVRDEWISR